MLQANALQDEHL